MYIAFTVAMNSRNIMTIILDEYKTKKQTWNASLVEEEKKNVNEIKYSTGFKTTLCEIKALIPSGTMSEPHCFILLLENERVSVCHKWGSYLLNLYYNCRYRKPRLETWHFAEYSKHAHLYMEKVFKTRYTFQVIAGYAYLLQDFYR